MVINPVEENIYAKILNEYTKLQESSDRINLSHLNITPVLDRWLEPWRKYHIEDHLLDLLEKIDTFTESGKMRTLLYFAALYHDAIYLPWSSANEENSLRLWFEHSKHLNEEDRNFVRDCIMVTSYREPEQFLEDVPRADLVREFWEADNSVLLGDANALIEYEHKIFKEYQFVPYCVYREERLKFLNSCLTNTYFNSNEDEIQKLITYVKNRKIRVGFYPGSFKPMHSGHVDIIKQAEHVFDKVIIGLGRNPSKKYENSDTSFRRCTFDYPTAQHRVQIPYLYAFQDGNVDYSKVVYDREVHIYEGTLVKAMQELKTEGVEEVVLIRGLRNGHDLDYEQNTMAYNREIDESIQAVCFLCKPKFAHISSSAMRELEKVDTLETDAVYTHYTGYYGFE